MPVLSPLISIPLEQPDITELEIKAAITVLKDVNNVQGLEAERFEALFKDYYEVRNAITVSSGMAGLHLSLRAAGVLPGDIVITSPFSDISIIQAINCVNATPVFLDIEEMTFGVDGDALNQAIHDLTCSRKLAHRWLPRRGVDKIGILKTVLLTDNAGIPTNLEGPNRLADEFGIKIIEEASGAFGARYLDRRAGAAANFGVIAFQPGSEISACDGGMIVTDDDSAADFMRILRDNGRDLENNQEIYTHSGYHYRLGDLNAAMGRAQLSRIDSILLDREKVAGWYSIRLTGIPALEIQQMPSNVIDVSWPVYIVRLDESVDRAKVIEELAVQGYPSRPYHPLLHLQPFLKEKYGYKHGDLPNAESLAERMLTLPFSGNMSEKQVDSICNSLKQILS